MTHSLVTRRSLLQSAALAGSIGLLPGLVSRTLSAAEDPAALAQSAALWGYPLVQTGRYLQLAQDKGFGFNQFYLNSRLATPALHVAGPNVDTIYGFAWLDLSKEPIVLDVPDTHDRYYSIQLIDAYENTFAYVGRRATGTKAGSFVITAPNWTGHVPHGTHAIAAPTTLVLALTRTLVRNEADAPVAAELQQRYTLAPLSAWPKAAKRGLVQDDALNIFPVLNLSSAGAGFFDELNRLVHLYPPTGAEAVEFSRLSPLGLGTDAFPTRRPSDAALTEAFANALGRIQALDPSQNVNGWRVDYKIRPFIGDPAVRAAVNRFGPGAHIAEEALYFYAAADLHGQPLSGEQQYRFTIPAKQPLPVDGFWSVILYGADFFLVDNPLNRYTINDRTSGLKRNSDGSLTILIQHAAPSDPSNWLPAPEGHFQVLLRTYQPRVALLDGSYKPPPLEHA